VGEEIAAANTASAKSVGSSRGRDGIGSEQGQLNPSTAVPSVTNATIKESGKKDAPALLPDDTQHETRPEEILPFFQFPGSGGTAVVVPSGPVSNESTRLPVSTAVYRER
jgi:hypothetical protein